MTEKLKLYGFNNLTKTLSFNLYDVCYAETPREQEDYLEYIDEQYNSERITAILCRVTEMIGANILNISKQDYDPRGASVNILISEDAVPDALIDPSNNRGILPSGEIVHAHLDKSHITVHTFPEAHPNRAISTFRVDIEVSTCGRVSPLNVLDFLINSFESDIMSIDYRVRGFTRDKSGRKHFLDHKMTSIQDYIGANILSRYQAMDVNVYQSNIFHTKLMIRDINLQRYMFNFDTDALSEEAEIRIKNALKKEMSEIYSGTNIYDQ